MECSLGQGTMITSWRCQAPIQRDMVLQKPSHSQMCLPRYSSPCPAFHIILVLILDPGLNVNVISCECWNMDTYIYAVYTCIMRNRTQQQCSILWYTSMFIQGDTFSIPSILSARSSIFLHSMLHTGYWIQHTLQILLVWIKNEILLLLLTINMIAAVRPLSHAAGFG